MLRKHIQRKRRQWRIPIPCIRTMPCSTPPRMSLRRCPSSNIRSEARSHVKDLIVKWPGGSVAARPFFDPCVTSGKWIAEKTGFTPQERNIVYLAIIYENECTYCMAGHTNLSRMAKVDPEAITAVREGRPIADPRLEALRQFAAKVTRNRGVVSEADVS